MDLDNPVIAKLFDRAYGEKLAAETQKLVAEAQKAEQKLQEELAVATSEAKAARRDAEAARDEAARQWQELMLKVLEHRFVSVPVALVRLLQAVKPAQRSHVSDIILDSPDADACLQALRQLPTEG